jgi:hypothetical protein
MSKAFLWPTPSDGSKIFPSASPRPTFVECGCCGCWHDRDLPGRFDCRDDAHRFTTDELDARYGAASWDEVTLNEQLAAEERAS